ncbi:hypothetical protein L5G28_07490 [Gordonia sp. HY285]|uniref:DUF7432 family protein n=1 Tax=Gordonia liuliyuniae TaxID=2911517 RepID=UPI001F4778FD|nr:hypothetical protein [Gordonia liuliyuniae]MCF8610003.1 hypothetical protein [Gordonia liuliyuniae]
MRPENHSDLPSYQTESVEVASVDLDLVAGVPGAVAAYGAFLDTLHGVPGITVKRNRVTADRTDSELDGFLRSEQRAWDTGREAYEKWIDGGIAPSSQYVWAAYLRAEGISAPADMEYSA